MSVYKRYGLIFGLLILAGILLLPTPDGLSTAGHRMLGILIFSVVIWMTEAVSYPVSAAVIMSLMAFLLGTAPNVNEPDKILGTTKGLEDDMLKKIFFIVHHDMRHADNQVNVGDQVVLSVGTEQKLGDQIHWGVWREDANNLEAFRFNDVDNINSNDPVYDGDLVLVRSKNDDKWWKVITDTTTESPTVRVLAAATSVADATQFTISRVR